MLETVVSLKKQFDFFFSNLLYQIVFFAYVITIYGLLYFFDILTSKDFLFVNSITEILSPDTLVDYNFAIVPVFFGFIAILVLMSKTKVKIYKVFYVLSLVLFSLQIFFSGSRRGMIVLILSLILLALSQIFIKNSRWDSLKKVTKESLLFLVLFFSMTVLTYFFVTKTSYYYKNRFLEIIGSKNILITKDKVTKHILKYSSFIDKSTNYLKLYNTLWTPAFNPNDPDSGWGDRIHKTVFPLEGKNVEMIPAGAKGYLMDSTCNASYYPKIDLSESYSLLTNLKVNKGDRYRASVFCFVSEKYNGSTVSLGVGSSSVNVGVVSGNVVSNYNLNERGTWQKLEIQFDCNDGDIAILADFLQKGVKNFSNLKGYVIFAYPQYEKICNSYKGLSPGMTQNKNENAGSGLFDLSKYSEVQKSRKSSEKFERIEYENKAVDLCNPDFSPNIFLSKNINFNKQKYIYSGIFCFLNSILSVSGAIQIDSDPIRKWASKFISEDTTYYPYKSNIILDPISNPFIADRLLRWKFALKIFSNEYNWKQRIFGGGFNFLNWYGFYFYGDRTRSDYPHNPFLHILLYSGILGLAIYLIFFFKVFYYYLKYSKEYPLFFVFFIITFFFSFFSSGSPFDPPIMGFFVILPFFIHSVHKKEEKALTDSTLTQDEGLKKCTGQHLDIK
jgi:hypothetical protein